MDDYIHQSTFQYINSLSKDELPLQVLLHMVSCVSALRDILEQQQQTQNNNNKGNTNTNTNTNRNNNSNSNSNSQSNSHSLVNTHIVYPWINGMLGTLGKIIMDGLSVSLAVSGVSSVDAIVRKDRDRERDRDRDSFVGSYQLVVQHTLKLFPEMTAKKHKSSGKILLHHAVFKGKATVMEDTVRTIVSVSPDAASVQDTSGALALHWATRNPEMTGECIDLLVQANPQSTSHSDEKGFLPLHWAVNKDEPNVEIVRKLLRLYPNAAKIPTNAGNLPIHCCVAREKPSTPVIKALLGAYPNGMKAKCKEGFLPLHRYTQRAPIDGDVLRQLIQYYPNALTEVTNRLQTPLHVALDFPLPDIHGINIMLNEDPSSCGFQDADGYYPLHLILDCAIPDYATAQRILLSYPDGAKAKTKEGMFPLHLVVSTNDAPPASFLTMLLEANPEAINHEGHDIVPAIDGVALVDPESWSGEWVEKSWTPITRARERGLTDVVQLLLQFPKKVQDKTTKASTTSKAVSSSSTAAAIKQSQPIRTIPEQTPPRKFLISSQQDVQRLDEESTPEINQPESKFAISSPQRPTSSPVLNLESIEEDRNENNEPLVDNFLSSGNSRDGRQSQKQRNNVQEQTTPNGSRAPPAGPIPNTILQAAESNAMRLSKAQYEFLKSGKINKKAIRGKSKTPTSSLAQDSENSDTGDDKPRPFTNTNYSSNPSDSDDNQIVAPLKVKKSSVGKQRSNVSTTEEVPSTPVVTKGFGSNAKSKVHPITIISNNTGAEPHEMV